MAHMHLYQVVTHGHRATRRSVLAAWHGIAWKAVFMRFFGLQAEPLTLSPQAGTGDTPTLF